MNEETKKQYGLYCGPYYSVQKVDEQAIFYNRLKLKMDILIYFFTDIIKEFDCTQRINQIKVPTLILTGEKDPIATIDSANLVAEQLGKNCHSHVVISNTSHNLIWEKTNEVMNNIKKFIE